jgi:hypothetical protein
MCGIYIHVESLQFSGIVWQDCLKGGRLMNVLRIVFWTVGLAYGGSFLFAGRSVQSLRNSSISGALIGGLLGLFIAMMLTRRAKRKHV